jgi:hypothetical protein
MARGLISLNKGQLLRAKQELSVYSFVRDRSFGRFPKIKRPILIESSESHPPERRQTFLRERPNPRRGVESHTRIRLRARNTPLRPVTQSPHPRLRHLLDCPNQPPAPPASIPGRKVNVRTGSGRDPGTLLEPRCVSDILTCHARERGHARTFFALPGCIGQVPP